VRTLATKEGLLFYAVNRERYAVTIQIALNRSGKGLRLSTNAEIASVGKSITLELQPYELIVTRLEPGLMIEEVRTQVAPAERKLVEDTLAWVKRLATSKRLSGSGDKTTVDAAATAATTALRLGRLWRVRTLLEHNSMLAVYRRTGCFPPIFSHVDTQYTPCSP
jgi:hypothetical protein